MVAGPNRSKMVDDGQSRGKAMEDGRDDAGALVGTPGNREAEALSCTVLDRPVFPIELSHPHQRHY
jgi:hypothetical protein